MEKDVSVILPYRDASKTIRRAVESILGQTFENFELVLINDGSTDHTEELLAQYRDSRIRRINLRPSGIVTALNEGIYSTKARYIARMDADDVSYPQRLEKQLEYLESHPNIDVVACKVNYIGNIEKNYGFFHYVEWNNGLTDPDDIYLNRFVESPVTHPSIMMRTKLVKKFGGYAEGEFPEDYEYWLRLMDEGIKIAKLDEVLLDWFDDEARLSRRHKRYSIDAFYKIKTKYFARWYRKFFNRLPQILIWGTGKSVIQKSGWLSRFDIDVDGYIDVIEKNDYWIDGKPVFYYKDLPSKVLILSYVSDRKGRVEIHQYLKQRGYEEGHDFYMMA